MSGKNVLAIGAHPDDIELGCGGTLPLARLPMAPSLARSRLIMTVSDVTVNLTLNSTGTVVASTTTTDSNGDYLIIDQAPGEYTLTASKTRFWSDNSISVTVNFDETVTANCALWLKGDLNNN